MFGKVITFSHSKQFSKFSQRYFRFSLTQICPGQVERYLDIAKVRRNDDAHHRIKAQFCSFSHIFDNCACNAHCKCIQISVASWMEHSMMQQWKYTQVCLNNEMNYFAVSSKLRYTRRSCLKPPFTTR